MKWHIDPPYDPLQMLQECKEAIDLLTVNNREIVKALVDHSHLINELKEQNKLLYGIIQQQKREIHLLQADQYYTDRHSG